MSRIFKNLVKELGTEAGIEVIRGYVLERLRKVTTDDLYYGIKNKMHTMGVTEEKDRNFAKRWVNLMDRLSIDGKRLEKEDLTPENVLIWLKEDRPDLASLIINIGAEGKAWLEEDVKQVFKFLFPTATAPKAAKPQIKLIKRNAQQKPQA